MCIRPKTGENTVNLALIPVVKPHTYKLYILKHCTNIVYIHGPVHFTVSKFPFLKQLRFFSFLRIFFYISISLTICLLDFTMNSMVNVCKETENVCFSPTTGVHHQFCGEIRVASLFSVVCFCFCFVCLPSVSCVYCCRCLWIVHY